MDEIKGLLLKSGFKQDIKEPKNIFTIKNHYQDNFGFIHILGNNLETVLIKGTYKNFIKNIKNSETFSKEIYTKIAEIITNFERSKIIKVSIKAAINENDIVLVDAQVEKDKKHFFDRRKQLPFSALTEVEYSLFHNLEIRQNTLFSNGFLSYIFPETMSPLTASLFKTLENVFNPLSEENSIKTLTPSIKHIFAKPYTNLNNLDIFFNTLKGNNHFFLLNYAPHLFVKLKKIKFKEFDLSFIKENEFETYFNDAKEAMEEMQFDNFLENLFITLANVYAIFIIFFLKFNNAFSILYNINQNISEILKLIYLTKKNSILRETINLPTFFDTSSKINQITPLISQDTISIEEALKEFAPKSTLILKKKKIINVINEIHYLLNTKDRLIKFCVRLFEKAVNILKQVRSSLVKNHKIKEETDINFFEFQELLDLYNDNFFANYVFNYTFKIWQNERFSSQIIPLEIYEEDIPNIKTLSEKLISKLSESNTPNSLIFFTKNIGGKISHLQQFEENRNDDIVFIRSVPISLIPQIAHAKCYIVESMPIFSCFAEYCTLNEKTVITGIRFAPLFYNQLKLKDGKLELIK